MRRRWKLSRRGFVIGLGSLGVLALGGNYLLGRGRMAAAQAFNSAEGFGTPPSDPNLWLEVTPQNQVRFFTAKVEMGQGVHTSLAQIVAEELDADWKTLEVVVADSNHGFDSNLQLTGGSISVSNLYTPLREAAATLRQMLVTEAAQQLGVAANDLVVMEGRIYPRSNPQQILTFGQVVSARKGEWEVPKEAPPLKETRSFTVIGQPMPRIDLRAKLEGKALYGYDARLEGMLYGAVARPPRYGATLKSVDASAAQSLPGVVQVVTAEGFAGVVATSRSKAHQAVEALKLEWEGGINWNQDELERQVTTPASGGVVYHQVGRLGRSLQQPTLKSEYRTPLAAHAHLEPQAALVNVKSDGVEVWVSSQAPQVVAQAVATTLGRKPEEVLVHPAYLGGGFGRKMGSDVAAEAARLSAAVQKPVHVGWTRLEELRHGYFRPPSHNVLAAQLGPDGRITALQHQIAGGDVFLYTQTFPPVVGTILGYDPGALSGALPLYSFTAFEGRAHRVALPVPTGWWRSLGTFPNTFALESFMDELAHTAQVDPLEFRLRHLGSDSMGVRARGVLEKVATMASWASGAPQGRARGIALGKYGGTVVAMIAEVSAASSPLKVEKVWAAVDCGLVVNPNGARAQTEGGIIMGISSALLEEITLQDGMAAATNFDGYPLLTLAQAPQIEVAFMEGGQEPFGMGEPAIAPVAPAVANALFALTGQRVRRLPLRLA